MVLRGLFVCEWMGERGEKAYYCHCDDEKLPEGYTIPGAFEDYFVDGFGNAYYPFA